MNGSPDFSETSQAHAELIEAVAREVIAGAAGVPRAETLTPVVNVIYTGGSGSEILRAFSLSGEVAQPINPHGNALIDCSNLVLNQFLADVYSPDAAALLRCIGTSLVSDFKFLGMSHYPAAGNAIKLRREFDRLMEEKTMRIYITEAAGNAGYTVVTGSLSSSAFFALATALLDQPGMYRNLVLVALTPSRQVNSTDNPQRWPEVDQRYETLLRYLQNRDDFTLVLINSEKTVGRQTGDPNISPPIYESAKVPADFIKRLVVDGSLHGTARADVHRFDLANAITPLLGKVGVPAIFAPDPDAERTLDLALEGALATGWENPDSVDIFGPLAALPRSWPESYRTTLLSRRMLGSIYPIDVPGGNILATIAVRPENAGNMLDHLK